MKPRLTYRHKIWTCRYAGTLTGYGYTPQQAYTEWMGFQLGLVLTRPVAEWTDPA